MPHSVFQKIHRWAMEDITGQRFYEAFSQIEFHAERRFGEYQPTAAPHPDFWARLRDWLNSAPDEADQKILLELVWYIFFIGSADFNTLYRAAYSGPIMRWLIDSVGLSILDPDLNKLLPKAVANTWFCPITDSMQIAAFYHINNIAGRNERPDWHSLRLIGDKPKVEEFVHKNRIERIVLLEDFVGSGSQMKRAVEFAASLNNAVPILIVPLIVCPDGAKQGRQIAKRYSRVGFEPALTLDEKCFVCPTATDGEAELYEGVRKLAQRLHPKVSGGIPPSQRRMPYGPFGFADTGSLTVMYSNCPNNTLPLIHYRSAQWNPLFPRSTRV